jgi:hypothetical protein
MLESCSKFTQTPIFIRKEVDIMKNTFHEITSIFRRWEDGEPEQIVFEEWGWEKIPENAIVVRKGETMDEAIKRTHPEMPDIAFRKCNQLI